MKKIIALVLAAVLVLGMASAVTAKAEEKTYTVGICQLVQHAALDAATEGFMDALTEKLGDNVKFDLQNAQGESTTCSTIVTGFVANEYDLIMANATPALLAAVSATDTIPILGTSVTDYATALAIDDMDASVGTGINVSGTSDGVPAQMYADTVMELVPEAKSVSVLYCSAEPNSVLQADQFIACMDELGVDTTVYTFTDSNDIQAVVTSAVEDADAMYIPTDNTAASNTEAIANVVLPAKVPVIAGEAGICEGCGVATLSISYYDLGVATGKMAAKILTGEADISQMPVEYAPQVTKMYNAANCEALGVTIPDGYEPMG